MIFLFKFSFSSDLVLWKWEVFVELREQLGDLTGLKFGGSRFLDSFSKYVISVLNVDLDRISSFEACFDVHG